MVAALSTKHSTPNRFRPPLIPSEKHNDALEAKPRTKEITSRYLSSPSSSSSSSFSHTKLRTPSPLPTASLPKRSLSANRARSQNVPSTTSRTLPVAFQGHTFSFQTNKARSTSDHREPQVKLISKTQTPNLLTRSLDCSSERKDPILAAARARFWLERGSPKKIAPLVSPRMVDWPTKRKQTPLRTRSGAIHPVDAPSVLSFAAEARRGKKGEGPHMLRLLHNRHLQWRCVNARSEAVLSLQRQNVEESLYNTSIELSKMRDSVSLKGMETQLLTQDIKLISILKGQMIYLEDWSLMDREEHNSLSGIVGALEASTLRLPIVGGARANIHELQTAIGSSIDVMQAMGTSICSLLPKAEVATTLLSEVVKTVALEQSLLDQSKDLLSKVALMHVKQCSLQGHIMQLNRRKNPMQR